VQWRPFRAGKGQNDHHNSKTDRADEKASTDISGKIVADNE
jgi:hypothetical protein